MTVNNKEKNIIIIGASGHAKGIIDIVEKIGKYNIIGLIDSFKPIGSKLLGYKLIGRENDIPELANKYNFNKGIIAIGDNWTRKSMHSKIIKLIPDFEFVTTIHPKSIIAKNIVIGQGSVIMAGAIVNSDAKIGDFCLINTKASLGHDSCLKKFSSLAPNSTIGGNVEIGKLTSICLSATVLQGVNIGKYSIIGAASLVNKNIPDYKMAYGIPAKIIKPIKKGQKYLYKKKKDVKKTHVKENTDLAI